MGPAVNNMEIDIRGLIKLFFFVITHPIGVYRFAREIIKWLNTNKFLKFNPPENQRTGPVRYKNVAQV